MLGWGVDRTDEVGFLSLGNVFIAQREFHLFFFFLLK